MKTLLIVYQSTTGGTLQMVQALAAAASAAAATDTAEAGDNGPALRVRTLAARDAGPDDLLAADAYVFACPENLAAIAGLMKDFFDRCYYPALEQLNGRACATLVCAGSDGQNAARQIGRIATGWRLKSVAPPLIVCTHAQTPEAILAPKTIAAPDLQRCAELGAALGAGLILGIY